MENEVQPQALVLPSADKAVGLTLQILAGLFGLAGFITVAFFGSVLSAFYTPFTSQPQGIFPGQMVSPQTPSAGPGPIIGVSFVILLVLLALYFWAATGVKESTRTGFTICLVMATLSAPFQYVAFVAVPIMIYCVLRLSGMLGPVPT